MRPHERSTANFQMERIWVQHDFATWGSSGCLWFPTNHDKVAVSSTSSSSLVCTRKRSHLITSRSSNCLKSCRSVWCIHIVAQRLNYFWIKHRFCLPPESVVTTCAVNWCYRSHETLHSIRFLREPVRSLMFPALTVHSKWHQYLIVSNRASEHLNLIVFVS